MLKSRQHDLNRSWLKPLLVVGSSAAAFLAAWTRPGPDASMETLLATVLMSASVVWLLLYAIRDRSRSLGLIGLCLGGVLVIKLTASDRHEFGEIAALSAVIASIATQKKANPVESGRT